MTNLSLLFSFFDTFFRASFLVTLELPRHWSSFKMIKNLETWTLNLFSFCLFARSFPRANIGNVYFILRHYLWRCQLHEASCAIHQKIFSTRHSPHQCMSERCGCQNIHVLISQLFYIPCINQTVVSESHVVHVS